MRHLLLLSALALVGVSLSPVAHATRTKDIASFYGMRQNQVTGAGIVVGLNRTGDSSRNRAAIRTLGNRLQGQGLVVADDEILSRNVALVMVSGTLTSDVRTGQRFDVTVASTGDARSLQGGYLLMTPLLGADGQIYAVAEGPVLIGGYSAESSGSSTQQNITTVGRIASGASVEREIASRVDYNARQTVDLVLHESDFTTAARLAEAINADFETDFETDVARAASSSTVTVTIPEVFQGRFPAFAARVEAVQVTVDAPARVVVNERTGTVVMGSGVQISAVAVAHGDLTIEVRRQPVISQPGAFSGGTTVSTSVSDIQATEEDGQLLLVEGVTIGELVSGLNDMGVTPRDLMVILEAIRAAGALHAEIVGI